MGVVYPQEGFLVPRKKNPKILIQKKVTKKILRRPYETIVLGSSLGQRNGRPPTWVDLAGIGPRDQTQGI